MTSPNNIRLITIASYATLIAMKNQNTVFTINVMFRPPLDDHERDLIMKRIDELESAEKARPPMADWIDPGVIVPKGAE